MAQFSFWIFLCCKLIILHRYFFRQYFGLLPISSLLFSIVLIFLRSNIWKTDRSKAGEHARPSRSETDSIIVAIYIHRRQPYTDMRNVTSPAIYPGRVYQFLFPIIYLLAILIWMFFTRPRKKIQRIFWKLNV